VIFWIYLFSNFVCHSWSVPMMKMTSHLFKWENLYNWWLTKYFFPPLYVSAVVHLTAPFVVCCLCRWFWMPRRYVCLISPWDKEVCLETLRDSTKCVFVPAESCSCPRPGSPPRAAKAKSASERLWHQIIPWWMKMPLYWVLWNTFIWILKKAKQTTTPFHIWTKLPVKLQTYPPK
jgi:hypothetical protein